MITSRTRRLALSIAETFTALLRGIPLLESVTEPIRLQTGYGISSRTVISAPTDFTDARISCSLSSRFQTASSLVKNVSKDLNRKTVTNTVEINKKRQNFEQNEETSNRGNDQNCENGKKFFSVKGAFVSANITELAVKKLPFTVPVRSVLPVKKLSKFKIPGKIPGDVIILKDDKNKKGLTDNVAGGKRKSSEIGDKYIISKLQKKINSEDKDKNEKNELDNNEHRKEKKKLGGKKDPVSPEKELKKNNSVEQGRIGAKSSKKTKTESSVVRQNVKVTAKQRKASYQNDKTSGESIVKQTAVIPDSMIRASTPSIVTKKKENKNEKPPRKTEETLSKTDKMSSENIEKSAQPGPSIPVSLSGGGESSGDDSLSLGSENEINDAGDDEDDDNALFFEE